VDCFYENVLNLSNYDNVVTGDGDDVTCADNYENVISGKPASGEQSCYQNVNFDSSDQLFYQNVAFNVR
jgi:hypothetical protein